jgi:hypothetical protein
VGESGCARRLQSAVILRSRNLKSNLKTLPCFKLRAPMTIDLTESAVGRLIGDIAGHREYLNGPISEEGWKRLKEAIGETDNGREYERNKVKGLKF